MKDALILFMRALRGLVISPQVLAENGEIHVTLKTTARYNFWKVDQVALARGLHLKKVEKFNVDALYTHRRTNHDAYRDAVQNEHAALWVFTREQPEKAFKLPEWLNREFSRESHICELCDMIFTTEGDLRAHHSGKKHQARLKKNKRQKMLIEKKERKAGKASGGGDGNEGKMFCKICKIFSNSAADYQNHLSGKRHREATSA